MACLTQYAHVNANKEYCTNLYVVGESVVFFAALHIIYDDVLSRCMWKEILYRDAGHQFREIQAR